MLPCSQEPQAEKLPSGYLLTAGEGKQLIDAVIGTKLLSGFWVSDHLAGESRARL